MKLIVAVSNNGVIGNKGTLPWKCKEDLQHFRRKTIGNTVVMGYNTFKSCGFLPGRHNIVLAKENRFEIKDGFGLLFMDKQNADFPLEAEFMLAGEVFVIGGEKTYKESLQQNIVKELIVTHIDLEVEGDTFFEIPDEWYVYATEIISNIAIVKYYKKIKFKPCPKCSSVNISPFYCDDYCCGGQLRTIECKDCQYGIWADTLESWNAPHRENVY